MRALAQQVQSRGRGDDTMLVHMTPKEVGGLQALAQAHGGSLTVNPHTGLTEAGWLDAILPMVVGAVAGPLTGGLVSPAMAGLLVGGGVGLASGNIGKGLMAGLGAYGGASAASALGFGSNSLGMQNRINPSGKPMVDIFGSGMPAAAPTAPGGGATVPGTGSAVTGAGGGTGDPQDVPVGPARVPLPNAQPNITPQGGATGTGNISTGGTTLKDIMPYAAFGLPAIMSLATAPSGNVGTPAPVQKEYPYKGPYMPVPRVVTPHPYDPNNTSEKLYFDNVNPDRSTVGPLARGGLVALASGGNFKVGSRTASDDLQHLLDRFTSKEKLTPAENAQLVSGLGELYAGTKGKAPTPSPIFTSETAPRATPAPVTPTTPPTTSTPPQPPTPTPPIDVVSNTPRTDVIGGAGWGDIEQYTPSTGGQADPRYVELPGNTDISNNALATGAAASRLSNGADVTVDRPYSAANYDTGSNSYDTGRVYNSRGEAEADAPSGITPRQLLSAAGTVIGWIIPGVGLANTAINAGQGFYEGFTNANKGKVPTPDLAITGVPWIDHQLTGTGLVGDAGSWLGEVARTGTDALGITDASPWPEGNYPNNPSNTVTGADEGGSSIRSYTDTGYGDPWANRVNYQNPAVEGEAENPWGYSPTGVQTEPGAEYTTPDTSGAGQWTRDAFGNKVWVPIDPSIDIGSGYGSALAAYTTPAGYTYNQSGQLVRAPATTSYTPPVNFYDANPEQNAATSNTQYTAPPENAGAFNQTGSGLDSNSYNLAAGQARTGEGYGNVGLGSAGNLSTAPGSSFDNDWWNQSWGADVDANGKPVGRAAAGGIDLKDGSFVVDARTVSELGNGSSSAGQEILARIGGHSIHGPGDGVSDDIPANIDGDQEARVARDEVKFDPNTVARLGGGDPKKGADILYGLMNKAKKARKTAKRGEDNGLRRGLGGLV